jgi:hypothetical protein
MLYLLSLAWLYFFRIRRQSKGEITIKEGENTIEEIIKFLGEVLLRSIEIADALSFAWKRES